MDKKELTGRLQNLKKLKESHQQDITELEFVITGLEGMIAKLPEETKTYAG